MPDSPPFDLDLRQGPLSEPGILVSIRSGFHFHSARTVVSRRGCLRYLDVKSLPDRPNFYFGKIGERPPNKLESGELPQRSTKATHTGVPAHRDVEGDGCCLRHAESVDKSPRSKSRPPALGLECGNSSPLLEHRRRNITAVPLPAALGVQLTKVELTAMVQNPRKLIPPVGFSLSVFQSFPPPGPGTASTISIAYNRSSRLNGFGSNACAPNTCAILR